LNVEVADVERDQRGGGKGATAWTDRVNAAPGWEDQAVERAVVVAVVSGVGPSSDRLGNVIVAADESRSVDVERLPGRMGVSTPFWSVDFVEEFRQ